jgi:nicotinamide-nucleotide amidase
MTMHMAGHGAGTSVSGKERLLTAASDLLQQLDLAKMKIATAESCTGGFLTSLLTDIEGLSHCVDRGYIVYTEEAKHAMLGICCQQIERHGAVSEPVARAMAQNALQLSNADLALAITGFAGPSGSQAGGQPGAGTTFIGAAIAGQSWVYRINYGRRPRREVRNLATLAALIIAQRTLAVHTGISPTARQPARYLLPLS